MYGRGDSDSASCVGRDCGGMQWADLYTLPVIDLPVWIADWVYECCGPVLHAGELVTLELTFHGDTVAASEPDSIEVLEDGRVSIVGTALGSAGDEDGDRQGTVIASGGVRFAIAGDAPAARVRCTGELAEDRHGFPAGATAGEVVGVRWRPAILREVGGRSFGIVGYGPGYELSSTADRPGDAVGGWAFELTVRAGR